MGGPCYFTHRFSSILATTLNQCVKYFDINYFWLPMVSKQLVLTPITFYFTYLILLLFNLNLCLCFISKHLEDIFGQILILSSKKLFAACTTKARIVITTTTIQFMHLVLVWASQTVLHLSCDIKCQTFTHLTHISCNFTFILTNRLTH